MSLSWLMRKLPAGAEKLAVDPGTYREIAALGPNKAREGAPEFAGAVVTALDVLPPGGFLASGKSGGIFRAGNHIKGNINKPPRSQR